MAAAANEINAFFGGMNTVTAPYLISPEESILLVNVDIRRGSMWSMPKRKNIQSTQEAYFYQFAGTIYEFGSWRSNVLWDNRWYWSDGASVGKVLPDGTEKTLGLPTPGNYPTLSSSPSSNGPHSGEFKFCYTFYDDDTGVESAPSQLAYISVSDADIEVSGMEALPTDATHWRIYRIGGYLPYLTLVAKTNSQPFLDNLDDTQIDGRRLQTLRNGPPPLGLHHLTEMNGRMYGAEGNRLYYSALGNPDSWYVYDVIPCQGEILGLAKMPGGLMVMGASWTNILKGGHPINFILKVVSDKVGIVDASSLAYIDQNAIWLARHGFVMSDGYTIKQLTSDKIEDIEGIYPVGAATLNNVYYMAYKPNLFPRDDLYPSDSLFPGSVNGTGGVDQGIISIDFKRGKGYAYRLIDEPDIISLGKVNGYIAGAFGTSSAELFPTCGAVAFPDCGSYLPCDEWEIAHVDKQTLDSGIIDYRHQSRIEYISPLFIDGTSTGLKEYDKVRVLFIGTFTISVLFDNDRVVVERDIVSTEEDEFDFALIGIPNKDNKSYSIRFVVEGTGIINGIQYSYKQRDIA